MAEPKGGCVQSSETSPLDILKPIMMTEYTLAVEARRRLWAARDEVARLEAHLHDARTRLVAAERDKDDHEKHLALVWEHLRSELQLPSQSGRPQGGDNA